MCFGAVICVSMKKHPILLFFIVLSAIFVFFISMMLLLVVMVGGETPSFADKPIALINIQGPIFESDETVKELQEFAEDDKIKAVVIRIDSPGGAVGPSQEIFEQVKSLKQKKKVIVSMGTVAASGGYYIACAADKIVANEGTITGSIGVIMEMFGLQKLTEKLELEHRVIKSGAYKDVGDPFRDLTDSDKAYLQAITDDMYDQFVSAVAINRNIDRNKMSEIAEGRVYTGRQALQNGLVDVLGNVYKAIELARTEAGLPSDAKVRWPKEPSAFEEFMSGEEASLSFIKKALNINGEMMLPMWISQQYRWR